MKKLILAAIIASSAMLTGCERITTGEVGIRMNASREIQGTELQPGSWNQTLVGSVLTFPIKDIAVNVENKTPLTADNTALDDFDVTVVYAINPSSVSELYTTKSKSFHATDDSGDIFLMYNYIATLVNNASYKAVREYKALEVADNRVAMEAKIRNEVNEQLREEGLANALTITVVQVRNAKPNAEILKAATEYVRAQNQLRIKATEVEIAQKEAERMAALSNNSVQSIAYMNAQANMMIAEGIRNGKVNTIVVPVDFKGIVSTAK